MNVIGSLRWHIVLLLVLLIPGVALAVPEPLHRVNRENAWELAWDEAWELAWQASGALSVASALPDDPFLEESVQTELEQQASGVFGVTWGVEQTHLAVPSDARTGSQSFEAGHFGRLFVNCDPADASVRLVNGEELFSQGMNLPAGQYVIDVARPGFNSQMRRVEIIPGMAATVKIDLAPAELARGSAESLLAPGEAGAVSAAQPPRERVVPTPPPAMPESSGRLYVRTEPAGAVVRVVSIKPKFQQGMELTPGRYRVDAAMDGYETSEQTIEILPGRDYTATFRLAIAKPKGRLYVQAEPANAVVRVKHIRPKFFQGMELRPGRYTIDIAAPGFNTLTQEVDIASGENNTFTVALAKATQAGRLYVKTSPDSAVIRLLGIKPVFSQGIELAPGRYTVAAEHEGYNAARRQIEIKAGQDNVIALDMKHIRQPAGRLYVKTNPPAATVRVLNIRPKFEQGMELKPGTYALNAALDGYQAIIRNVDIAPGKDIHVDLTLEKASLPLASAPAEQPEAPALHSAVQPKDESVQFDVDAFLSMATLGLNVGDYQAALRAADYALRLAPRNAQAFKARGDAYLQMHDFDSAIANYRQVLALEPEDTHARHALSQVEERRGSTPGVAQQSALDIDRPAQGNVAVAGQ